MHVVSAGRRSTFCSTLSRCAFAAGSLARPLSRRACCSRRRRRRVAAGAAATAVRLPLPGNLPARRYGDEHWVAGATALRLSRAEERAAAAAFLTFVARGGRALVAAASVLAAEGVAAAAATAGAV